MDKNETIIAVTGMIASQKQVALTGSYLLGSMVVFTDPSYLAIGIIGSAVSIISHDYDIQKEKMLAEINGTTFLKHIGRERVKALTIGFLFTIAFFLFAQDAGTLLIKKFTGLSVVSELLPSFYMILTLYLSTLSIGIYDIVARKVKA